MRAASDARAAARRRLHRSDSSDRAASWRAAPRIRSPGRARGPLGLRLHALAFGPRGGLRGAALDVRFRDADRELADAKNERGAFGDADAVARVEDVEQMRALQRVLERGPDELRFQQRARELVVALEQVAVEGSKVVMASRASRAEIDLTEHGLRLLHFFAQPHVAVLHAGRPLDIEDGVHTLQGHRDALEPVGQLRRNRRELETAGLLEVRELRDLHPVEHHLPADAPRAERRRLPVVLLESDVVLARVDAARLQAFEIQLLHFVGRGLEDRKSTRLNSSHVRISYAVFCLKKKKSIKNTDANRT